MEQLVWVVVEHNMVRARIAGGWLYKVSNPIPMLDPKTGDVVTYPQYCSESITFIPDPSGWTAQETCYL